MCDVSQGVEAARVRIRRGREPAGAEEVRAGEGQMAEKQLSCLEGGGEEVFWGLEGWWRWRGGRDEEGLEGEG